MPEKELWLRVLIQAIEDAGGNPKHPDGTNNRKRLAAEARAWFRSERDGTGTFRWICDELNLNRQRIRFYLMTGAVPEGANLGARAFLYRKAHGLTQHALADMAGIDHSSVANIESNRRPGTGNRHHARDRLAEFLGNRPGTAYVGTAEGGHA